MLNFIIYGFSLISMSYCLSFAFKSPGGAQVFSFIIFSILSLVLVALSFVMKTIESTRSIGFNLIPYIFNVLPTFSFGNGFMNAVNDENYQRLNGWLNKPTVFSERGSRNELIYLSVTTGFLILLLSIIESWQSIFKSCSKKKSKKALSFRNEMSPTLDTNPELSKIVDEDVLAEDIMVQDQVLPFEVYVSNLQKYYSTSPLNCMIGSKVKKAVDGVSFGVEQGTVFCLLGTNGAGKTSTFKVLTGDEFATSGEACIRGKFLPDDLQDIRHLVGYCPQFNSLCDKLTAEEHLQLYCELKGIAREYHTTLIEHMLESLQLQKFRNVQSGEYSGGNKRKLSIAIALIGQPPIVFLDEPSAGMDPEARRFMWNFIAEITQRRSLSTIILTTHSMEEAQALSSKVAIMAEGKIKAIGTIQRLKDKYGRGVEVEIKVKLPNEELFQTKKELYDKLTSNQSVDCYSRKDIDVILKESQLETLSDEIDSKKSGSAILQRLETVEKVENKLFIEWVEIQKRMMAIRSSLSSKFDCKFVESYQTYIKINITDQHPLSEVFGFMEENSEKLFIASFAVRGISLEQIFINFGDKVVHEGD